MSDVGGTCPFILRVEWQKQTKSEHWKLTKKFFHHLVVENFDHHGHSELPKKGLGWFLVWKKVFNCKTTSEMTGVVNIQVLQIELGQCSILSCHQVFIIKHF